MWIHTTASMESYAEQYLSQNPQPQRETALPALPIPRFLRVLSHKILAGDEAMALLMGTELRSLYYPSSGAGIARATRAPPLLSCANKSRSLPTAIRAQYFMYKFSSPGDFLPSFLHGQKQEEEEEGGGGGGSQGATSKELKEGKGALSPLFGPWWERVAISRPMALVLTEADLQVLYNFRTVPASIEIEVYSQPFFIFFCSTL